MIDDTNDICHEMGLPVVDKYRHMRSAKRQTAICTEELFGAEYCGHVRKDAKRGSMLLTQVGQKRPRNAVEGSRMEAEAHATHDGMVQSYVVYAMTGCHVLCGCCRKLQCIFFCFII